MRGTEARALVVERLTHDFSQLADLVVSFGEDGQLRVRANDWGGVADWVIDPDEDVPTRDIELGIARAASDIADNLVPDEVTGPWPRCPTHGDHPLQPQLFNGRASWVCLREALAVAKIGALAE